MDDASPTAARELADGGGEPLSVGLKQRRPTTPSPGGVIGAGLFVGSGAGIAAWRGPASWSRI